jgi:hypothetical protein
MSASVVDQFETETRIAVMSIGPTSAGSTSGAEW